MSLLVLFSQPWNEVPVIVVDVETTGIGREDRACQVGFARFEAGKLVSSAAELINPGRPIPPEATAIHGITDSMVATMPTIEEVFVTERVKALVAGAQPLGFNGLFDRFKVPTFTDPAEWWWIDPLVLIRDIDKFVGGKGRHKLGACCQRHGIEHAKEHDAGADAIAAGKLFYAITPKWLTRLRITEHRPLSLGHFLHNQRLSEADQYYDHWSWRAQQPIESAAG